MNKKYNLKLDLQFRCNNSTMKFDEFDNNTSDFFIRVTRAGELIDISKAIVTLVVIKPDNSVDAQFVDIDSNRAYCHLKPTMKNLVGKYEAIASITVDGETVNTGIDNPIIYEVTENKFLRQLNQKVVTEERFTLLTDMINRLSTIEISEEQRVINEAERILSEENRKIEEAERVEAELIRQHEEADRAKYDATRESNENIRKQNESIRLANEANRIDEEAKRVEEENKRKLAEEERNANYNFMTEDEERRRLEANAHKEAEKLRAQAENTRVNEEAKRRTTEQARVSAENTRVSNENTRKANEATRQNNETKRVETETQRQNRYNSFIADAEANASNFENYTNSAKIKEEERKSNELNRKSQEDRRVSNEVERISNENTRKANEAVREKNETSRQYVFENKVDEVDKKIVEINTTKDNFVSNISTKVDTKISEIDNVKDNFVSSVNTKVDSKISELDTAKSDMTNTVSNKVNEVETRFNALTSSQQQDAEVIDARDGETSLKARLDRDIEKAKEIYVPVEGSHVSTDSSSGYAKDVEIFGNTVQDASNLADIRSVGDKVEGQELYEIPVLSVGKNLLNKNNVTSNAKVDSSGNIISDTNTNLSDYIKLKANKTYCKSNSDMYAIYDGNKNFISRSAGEVISLSNDGYVRLFISSSVNLSTYQLEEGTQATPYEPYQEDKLTILSPTPLEKVGDVRDRIIEKDGVWGVEKNVETVVLSGSEDWNLVYRGTVINSYRIQFNQVKPHINTSNELCNIVCDKFIPYTPNGRYRDVEQITVASWDNESDMFINKSISDVQDVNDFKQWLQANNVTVKYPTTKPQFIPLPHDQQVKLRTFANKTNISFLTEIEGTIKAQVPKSIGSTVNTHTEQISNLNKELDRVKKLEESTVSTVNTESGFTTVEATTRGYFEDVKLEGKTLVNKFNLKSKSAGVWNYINFKNDFLKLGETYTAIVFGLPSGFRWYVSDSVGANSYCQYTTSNMNTFVPNIITGDNGIIHINDSGKTSLTLSDLEKIQITILEGDHTQNPPNGYIEGLKSVGQNVEEIVVSSVKGDGNLFDGRLDDVTILTDGNNLGKLVEHSSVNSGYTSHIKPIPIQPNTIYEVGIDNSGLQALCMLYDNNMNPLCFEYGVNGIKQFTTPNNAKYARVRYQIKYSDINNYNMYLVKIGDTSKDYMLHQSDKKRLLYYNEETQAWEKPILRQWDSIEKHANGKYYYHVRSIEEDYTRGDESVSNYITDMTTTVKPLAQEKVYECTNIDLITYNGETNFIVESGVLSPRTTLKVHSNISNVVSLLQKKVSLLESNVTSYMTTQNRLMLASRYNSDAVSFKVDYAVCSENMSQENYDTDLYNLILNNILVGKDNYDYDHMFNIIMDYASWSQISWDQFDILVGLMDIQHNPPIEEIPTDDEIVEEIPNEIM